MLSQNLTAFALAFGVSVVLVWLLAKGVLARGAVDIPNERSLHKNPVPRNGGLGLLVAAGLVWLSSGIAYPAIVGIAAALCAVSFLDDLGGLPVKTRLLVQAASAAVFLALYPVSPLLLVPLAALAIVWMSNLFNFMDGSDGLAGGMTVCGFLSYAVAAAAFGSDALTQLSLAISGAALGFLVWNFHKASIFMGDSGSVPLGFLAAALGIVGWQEGAWPFWFPPLVFSPFIVDASATLVRRLLRGEKLSQAHRTHYYQRALQMGLGHRGTALSAYVLMAGTAATALLARSWSTAAAATAVAIWAVVYVSLMRAIDRRWAEFCDRPPVKA